MSPSVTVEDPSVTVENPQPMSDDECDTGDTSDDTLFRPTHFQPRLLVQCLRMIRPSLAMLLSLQAFRHAQGA